MHLHVLGAGSIGCLFAHHIARAGWPVTLLLRRGALDAFDAGGRRVRCGGAEAECGAEAVATAVAAAPPQHAAQHQGPILNLLVTTKAAQTAAALASVAPRLTSESVVLLLQNGVLAVHEQLLGSFPDPSARPQFLLGSTTHGAWRRGPFDVVWAGQGAAVFGRPLLAGGGGDGSGGSDGAAAGAPAAAAAAGADAGGAEPSRVSEVLSALADPKLAALRIDARLTPEALHEQLVSKLLVNVAVNPLTALLHCRNGGLQTEPARALMRQLLSEAAAALGLAPPSSSGLGSSSSSGSSSSGGGGGGGGGAGPDLLARVEAVLAATSINHNSMLQDVVRGGATEIDYLNGYVVACAAARGVPAPLNEALVRLIRAREAVPPELRVHEELR